jgi:hypothetical protein
MPKNSDVATALTSSSVRGSAVKPYSTLGVLNAVYMFGSLSTCFMNSFKALAVCYATLGFSSESSAIYS